MRAIFTGLQCAHSGLTSDQVAYKAPLALFIVEIVSVIITANSPLLGACRDMLLDPGNMSAATSEISSP